jgi:hypothetical protein
MRSEVHAVASDRSTTGPERQGRTSWERSEARAFGVRFPIKVQEFRRFGACVPMQHEGLRVPQTINGML